MAERIKVDYDEVNDAVGKINKAIKSYNSLAEQGFDDAISVLDEMNSDYVSKLQQVLDCLNPKVKEKMNSIITTYVSKTSNAVDTMKKVDEAVARNYRGEQ